ncbi:cell wall hydrolase [Candidatus Pacearchaeota archaeon]|nr:cell wall hydrolase [Candidatus Pacearchaeota archaeon]
MNCAIKLIGLTALLYGASFFDGCARRAEEDDNPQEDNSIGISYKTDDFSKDSDKVILARMLFGEARNCSYEERLAVGFTALNRARDGKRWNGEAIREAVLKKWQYSCFNEDDLNRKKLMDPESVDAYNWSVCLTAAEDVLDGSRKKINKGQTNYHAKSMKKYPGWSKSGRMTKIEFPEHSKEFRHVFYRER